MTALPRAGSLALAAFLVATTAAVPVRAADPLVPAISQKPVSYDAPTNHVRVSVTVRPGTAATAPWTWTLKLGTSAVGTASTSSASVARTVEANCSTRPNVAVVVTDGAGATGTATVALNRSLCPTAPTIRHASDRIKGPATITESSFIARLRAVGSPALPEGKAIYATLVAAGINPSFALGTFHAESSSGLAGHATVTRNWGNILWYAWEAPFGAVPYDPAPVGTGYVYARYPTWLASIRGYVDLLGRYDTSGYRTVSQASAHWLGTTEGSDRHMRYLGNISAVMNVLPDDAVPTMTALAVPAATRPELSVSFAAKDNEGVTGYEVRTRPAGGAWSDPAGVTEARMDLVLEPGAWTIAVRAADAAGNRSAWREAATRVDALAPSVSSKASARIARAGNGAFTVTPTATDDVAVTRLQWRMRRGASGAWSTAAATTSRAARTFSLAPGSWHVGVRATDAAGNWSDWSETNVIVPNDDRAFRATTRAVHRKSSSAYRGTITTADRAGTVLNGSFTGSSLSLIGVAGPGHGKLQITVDGRSVTVDTGRYAGKLAARIHARVLLATLQVTPGRHAFRITNLATPGRRTIAIDALAFGG